MAVDDQPGDLIAFVGDQCFFEKTPERHIGQAHLRRHSLGVAARRDPGEQAPERAGLALAITSRRSSKRQVVPPTLCEYVMAALPT